MTRVSSRKLSLKEHGKGLELEPRGRETHGEAGAVTYGHGDEDCIRVLQRNRVNRMCI